MNETSVVAGDTVRVYIFTYDAPNLLKITGSVSMNVPPSEPFKTGLGAFSLYSGQQVKLDLSSENSLHFGNGDRFYSGIMLTNGVNDITIKATGDYRLYSSSWEALVFASFTIEYEIPPDAGGAGFIFLIVAVVSLSAMVFFARPQKIG
jgi:hypothetical protein